MIELLVGFAFAIDGDTIDMGGTRIRLWGIDAPEMATMYGEGSKRNLANTILKFRLTCKVKGKSYRRLVAQCKRDDGVDIGMAQVKQGYALDCARYSGMYYKKYETYRAKLTYNRMRSC